MGFGRTCVTPGDFAAAKQRSTGHSRSHRSEGGGRGHLKFLSCLSHDLNNNLAAIHLHLDLLKERINGSAQFTDVLGALELAQESIGRTTDGMKQLLLHERLRYERLPLRSDPIALQDMVRRIGVLFGASAARNGIELEIAIDRDAVVISDGSLIALVLQNLIGNAIKFSERGTVRVVSRRVWETGGDRWAVSVCDSGPGIPPGHLRQVFDAFWRGEARGNQGVGLGLAIAAAAAKRLGAELSVESQLGDGATFHLVFPAAADRAERCAAAPG